MNTTVQDINRKNNFIKIGIAYFVFTLVSLSGIYGVFFIVQILSPQLLENSYMQWIFNYGPLYGLAFPILLIIMFFIPNNQFSPPRQEKVEAIRFMQLLFASLAISQIVTIVYNFINIVMTGNMNNLFAETLISLDFFPTFFVLVIIAPIMEEIVFRYFLYKKLSAYGSKAYMLSSAFFFSLFHLNLVQSIYAFIIGFFLAWLMYKTGKIIYPILLHLLINLLGSGIGLISLEFFPEMIAGLISLGIVIIIIPAGIISIVFLILGVKKKNIQLFDPQDDKSITVKNILLNPGYIAFMVLSGAYIVYITITTIIR